MEVILGSTNTPKRNAVEVAFGRAFPEQTIEVVGVPTDSGVSSHPTSADESLQGAINRANGAKEQKPGADYYVGIEGGLLRAVDRAWEIAWVAILGTNGELATGLSSGIEIKGKILQAILGGQELNDVLDELYGLQKVGNANGFCGLATDDLLPRQHTCEDGVTSALAQFMHPEFYQES